VPHRAQSYARLLAPFPKNPDFWLVHRNIAQSLSVDKRLELAQ